MFPWVRVKNLASHALGLAARQLPGDWRERHGYSPVLLETMIDPERHAGTCYRAAGWQCLGLTKGAKAKGGVPAKVPKGVWARPLRPDWREILLHGLGGPRRKSGRPRRKRRRRTVSRACTQPGLPLGVGHVRTRTHDYYRHGTVCLFAALNYLEGKLIYRTESKHPHVEWLRFLRQIDREVPKGLDIHLIADS